MENISLPKHESLYKDILLLDIEEELSRHQSDSEHFDSMKKRVIRYHFILSNTITIIQNKLDVVPSFLIKEFSFYCHELINQLNSLKDVKGNSLLIEQYAKDKKEVIKFNTWSQGLFNDAFLNLISKLQLFDNKRDFKSEINSFINKKYNAIDEMEENMNSIFKELKTKTQKHITADYAILFKKSSNQHKYYSWTWLITAFIFTIIFILGLSEGWLNKLTTQETIGDTVVYNVGNIIARILILAVMVFIISFSFKQYNINRHIQRVNQHRANAFESYKLFDKILSKDDEIHRNELMLQLAKAIYEQTSTGYLSEKGSNFNLSLTEITKMLGKTQS